LKKALTVPVKKSDSLGMTFETQIKNLELRLRMAVEHVAQAEQDLNTIREKAGLGPAKGLPAGAEVDGWHASQARQEWLDRKSARTRALDAAPVRPQLSEAVAARIIALSRDAPPPVGSPHRAEWFRISGTLDTAGPAPAKVTADDIVRAAAIARGEIVELPPAGSTARAILEAAAKRRSETLDGKPL
jgi:hypothetical protein